VRLRDIATTLGVTERSALGIVTGLTKAGYVVNDKEAAGRGHRTHGNAINPISSTSVR
jgi:Mn-dependent DtxR family transcriptional regulator